MEQDDGTQDTTSCFSGGSIAGAVIGTFLTTILLLVVAAFLYRQWRRHKGKHLVLVTDPEIVDDAYAFDNPCFKDAATPAITRSIERPVSAASVISAETPVKDAARWSTSWSSLGLGSANRNDKRRTLDDSCLGPKATRVSLVSLRSRDFTGLGFNVCGNMREGIFIKDLLHRGPASESGRIHPGDRIASVKISFRNMVYEDALTILSYASPYDVELEVENGGPGSKPTTLLKKSVGPSPARICHPLYRSQSIPELSQSGKGTAKRLFTADLSDSLGNSSYTAMNSTIKSSKSSAVNQSLERPTTTHEDGKNNHRKFGIKVLPSLDGMVNRIENQNEHNTNLERRNSKKLDTEDGVSSAKSIKISSESSLDPGREKISESIQQRENKSEINSRNKVTAKGFQENGIDVPDKGSEEGRIPSEIPEEVHNAAVAARRNRRNSAELLSEEKNLNNDQSSSTSDTENGTDPKSPLQKNKRKAPAPPAKDKMNSSTELNSRESMLLPVGKKESVSQNFSSDTTSDDKFDSITDYTESLSDYLNKVRETTDGAEARRQRLENQTCRRNSESDTDSELQNSFTTIELNPADITIHHTPVPEVEDDDIYRKAASLGDLSKYESKSTSTLERAQSLDMTDTASSKKRKAPLPPEDINESTEDLTKLDDMDTFQRRKLKKSNEWGTLEDAIWGKGDSEELEIEQEKPKTRKKSKGTLERSKSAVEIKLKDDNSTGVLKPFDVSKVAGETSIELYNLPLSKKLSSDFINGERMFNPDADNSLARLVNDGTVVKSPTFEEVELDFRQAKPLRNEEEEEERERLDLEDALGYFDLRRSAGEVRTKVDEFAEKIDAGKPTEAEPSYYYKNLEVVEEPMKKTIVDTSCPGCRRALNGLPNESCNKHLTTDNKIPDIIKTVNEREKINLSFVTDDKNEGDDKLKSDKMPTVFQFNRQKFDPFDQSSKPVTQPSTFHIHSKKSEPLNTDDKQRESVSTFLTNRTKFEQSELDSETKKPNVVGFETHFAKRVVNLPTDSQENSETSSFEPGSNVTVNSKTISVTNEDRLNVSNVSVSSEDSSTEAIGSLVSPKPELIRQDSETTPPLPSTPMPLPIPHKLTYITEIKVSTSQENLNDINGDDEDIVSEPVNKIQQQLGVTVTSNGKATGVKKPPIPPRRSDVSKISKDESEKQVVYVSEYKSTSGKSPSMLQLSGSDVGGSETSRVSPGPGGVGKKFEQWVFLGENKENSWENSGGQQPQPVTNILLTSNDEKNTHK